MDLRHLTDKTLLADTKALAAKERRVTLEVLHHLKEIERRKLYSCLKYSSLFNYCIKELGYSESSAQRRIVAARLLKQMPELESKIQSGALSLTNLSQANQFFKDNHLALTSDKKEILNKIEGLSKRECERRFFELSGADIPLKEEPAKRVSADFSKLTLILSDTTLELINQVKDLMSKQMSMEQLIVFMAELTITELEKKKFKQVLNPRSTSESDKYIPTASVKREVYKRDKMCLQCGGRRNLNFDHRLPYSMGGKSDSENIRLLCFNCNQRNRIRQRL